MKNQTLFVTLMAIFAILFASSCSKAPQAGPGVRIDYSTDTIISHNEPITDSIGLCAGGKSKFLKIVGNKVVSDSITMTGSVNIPDQKLNESGYHYDGKSYAQNSGNSSDGQFHLGRFPWNLLLGILVLGLLIWFFIWLFRRLSNNKHMTHDHQHHHVHKWEEQQPVQKKQEEVVKPVKEVREDRIFLIGGLGVTTETLFRGQVQNHNGVQNIFNVQGNGNHVTINTNYPIEPKKDEPKQS